MAGKPTLTMPHLEVGDYVEIEHITPEAGDGAKGRQYHSPHWFFREADKGYWRSEFVMVTPADRELEIETRGNVPAAADAGRWAPFVERRWRVDLSPPARGRAGEPAHHRVSAERARGLGHLARRDAGAPGRSRERRDAARPAPARAGARAGAGRAREGHRRARAPRSTAGSSSTSRTARRPTGAASSPAAPARGRRPSATCCASSASPASSRS